jgi:hypothetical protein
VRGTAVVPKLTVKKSLLDSVTGIFVTPAG